MCLRRMDEIFVFLNSKIPLLPYFSIYMTHNRQTIKHTIVRSFEGTAGYTAADHDALLGMHAL